MKTLKNLKKGTFVRVSDVEAESRVKLKSEWAYAPKSEWKKSDNQPEETTETVQTVESSTKKTKKKK